MTKKIEVGEEVIGTMPGTPPYGEKQVLGVLYQRPANVYEQYLVRDKHGYLFSCYKIKRLKSKAKP